VPVDPERPLDVPSDQLHRQRPDRVRVRASAKGFISESRPA
jgi:hypothetical protein